MVPIIPSAAPNNTSPSPLSSSREHEIRTKLAWAARDFGGIDYVSPTFGLLRDTLAELDRVRAELAAKPVEDATVTEYGIAILDAGDEVVTNVTTDRDQALRRQAHIRTSYPLARLVSRTVSHGDWTEVTS